MAKTATHLHDHVVPNNIVQFKPKQNLKLHRKVQISHSLEQSSHLFIVILGTLIGASIALCIGYHLSSLLHLTWLALIPIAVAYLMRRMYIYTLLNIKQ